MFAVGSAGDGALCGKKTLQKHMVAQMDMDRRLTASICMLENESKARESRLETKIEQLEAKIEASSELLWARIENKFLKNVDVTANQHNHIAIQTIRYIILTRNLAEVLGQRN